jgi:hypothetical protein
MQLDQTRIPIKERGYLNLLDLALAVVRRHALGLLATSLLGAVPFALLNYWLLSDVLEDTETTNYVDNVFSYLVSLSMLMVWEMPLAAAPTTLFLGQAMFLDKPETSRLLRELWRTLPQILLIQVLLRGVLTALCITWLVLFWMWPYLNEIILLERNPLRGNRHTVTTFRRSSMLHHHYGGDLVTRWFIAVGYGGLWVLGLLLAIIWMRVVTTGGELDLGPQLFEIWLPVALWIVVSYFNVVRFLSYLDLRIRGEGWEIELRMRAEAQRLKGQLVGSA